MYSSRDRFRTRAKIEFRLRNDGPESRPGSRDPGENVGGAGCSSGGIDLKRFQDDVERELKPRANASTGIGFPEGRAPGDIAKTEIWRA